MPALGCPRFSVQRRQQQASDIEQENVVQPQSRGLGFLTSRVQGYNGVKGFTGFGALGGERGFRGFQRFQGFRAGWRRRG